MSAQAPGTGERRVVRGPQDPADHVELRGLRVSALVGVLPHEHQTRQPIELDIDVETDLGPAGQSDALDDTVNYGVLLEIAERVVATEHHQLLERLVQRVAEELLGASSAIVSVTVALRKLRPPVPQDIATTGVRITRRRMPARRALLALGSNLGNREGYLRAAIDAMVDVVGVSPVYETEPVGGPDDQGPYLNMVVALRTSLTARQLLQMARRLEAAAKRERIVHWGPRTLDVDVLWIDGETVAEPDLLVPHPRMFERDFVLAPLAHVAPDLLPPDWVAPTSVRNIGPL